MGEAEGSPRFLGGVDSYSCHSSESWNPDLSMLHQMKLHPEPFEKIRNGKKTVEVRVYDEKRRGIRSGDFIEFSKRPELSEKLKVMVKDVRVFTTFEDLFDVYSPQMLGTDLPKDKWLQGMMNYYTPEDIEKNGACAIELELT